MSSSPNLVKAVDIALVIIERYHSRGESLSNLRLQKLLYFSQLRLMKHDEWEISDDFVAWPYGPVIEEIYFLYKRTDILQKMSMFLLSTVPNDLQLTIQDCIDSFWEKGDMDLVELSHLQNPWREIWDDGKGRGEIIPKRFIKAQARQILGGCV